MQNSTALIFFCLKEGTVSVAPAVTLLCHVTVVSTQEFKIRRRFSWPPNPPPAQAAVQAHLAFWVHGLQRLYPEVVREKNGFCLAIAKFAWLNAACDFCMAQEMGLWNPKQTSHDNFSSSHADVTRNGLLFAVTAPSWLCYQRRKFWLIAIEMFSWLIFLSLWIFFSLLQSSLARNYELLVL